MNTHAATLTLAQHLERLDRDIELLEQQLEAKRAVRAQTETELALARRFPELSGFTRS